MRETHLESRPYTVTTPVRETSFKTCAYNVSQPGARRQLQGRKLHGLPACQETMFKTVNYTVCRPIQETCYKTCVYTVCRPVQRVKTRCVPYTLPGAGAAHGHAVPGRHRDGAGPAVRVQAGCLHGLPAGA